MTLSRAALVASLLITTACTQPAAQVEMKGQYFYAQRNANGYASNQSMPTGGKSTYEPAPVYSNTRPVEQSTAQAAGVQSITVADIAAPKKSETPAAKPAAPVVTTKVAAPEKQPEKPAEKQQASNAAVPVQRINPWTRKERSDFAASYESSSETTQPVSARKSVVAQTKPVTLSHAADANSNLMWPVSSHKVVSGFGPKGGGKVNEGINIASAEGEPVWAAADGEVVYVGNEIQGYGNMILVKHPGGKTTTYANLSRANVDKYDRVKQGDIIGYVGSTGNVKSPQLHFAVRDGKEALDPMKYLSRSVASN